MRSALLTEDHEVYRESVREFLARSVEPHYLRWEEQREVDREAWHAAGDAGIIGVEVPEEYSGGGSSDYRYRMVVIEEIARTATTSFGAGLGLQDDIVIPYFQALANDEQKQRWLPGLATGRLIGAIAMTEPGAGSDLQNIRTRAVPDGDNWRLTGEKTFITSGILSDVIVVFARTDPEGGARGGYTLFVVERGMPGFERGRKLHKVGLAAQDTAELSFDNVAIPKENVLGEVGLGFTYLMKLLPRERIAIAVGAQCGAEAAYQWAEDYCFERTAFGKRIGDLQATRFTLAELKTTIEASRAYVDKSAAAYNAGQLDAVGAAKAKWWAAEMQQTVTTRCLQLFGGFGYMKEYPIARAFGDARIQTIYGGTTEIMKEIIGRSIASGHRPINN